MYELHTKIGNSLFECMTSIDNVDIKSINFVQCRDKHKAVIFFSILFLLCDEIKHRYNTALCSFIYLYYRVSFTKFQKKKNY